jgi:8-oxo-dGTP diphosphatase
VTRLEIYAAVLGDDGTVLLVPGEDGQWDLPGGTVTLDESLEAALMRLVKEQTGLDVGVSDLSGLYQRPQDERLALVFRARALGGTVITGQWATPPAFPEGARGTVRLRVGDARRHERGPGLRLQ